MPEAGGVASAARLGTTRFAASASGISRDVSIFRILAFFDEASKVTTKTSARAFALLDGRPSVGFDDVRAVAIPVLNHRLVLDYRASLDGVTPDDIARGIIESVPVAE